MFAMLISDLAAFAVGCVCYIYNATRITYIYILEGNLHRNNLASANTENDEHKVDVDVQASFVGCMFILPNPQFGIVDRK